MAVITLTSDWGLNDYYVAAVKGMIYKNLPEVNIVDITHQVAPFDVGQAAYIIKNAHLSFPDGTIHIIGVNTEESVNHPHAVAYYNKQYFIGSDNGVFALIFESDPEKIIELDITHDSDHFTFSGRDRFAKAAVHLAKGGKIEDLGSAKPGIKSKMQFEPVVDLNTIKGVVTHIDTYENLITNIPKELFRGKVRGKKFRISLRSAKIETISNSYDDVSHGDVVALFASNDMLEIAINKGKAASLLGINRKSPVIIEIDN
jgi:S-adenosyl-L-methionine hydrolase (adenosine-forming)